LRKEIEQLRRREKELEREQEQLRQEQGRLRGERPTSDKPLPFLATTGKPTPGPQGANPAPPTAQRYGKTIPKQVDEVIAVPIPSRCSCGGRVAVEKEQCAFQVIED